jgi:hypothetical protein
MSKDALFAAHLPPLTLPASFPIIRQGESRHCANAAPWGRSSDGAGPMKVITFLAVLAGLLALAAPVAAAQAPGGPPPPPPADVRPDAAPLAPPLLTPDAGKDAVIAWLSQNAPAAHGRTVYVNGTEAFWIEHQDVDPKNDMKITATIHTENFADPGNVWRSSYEVTQFDCETQQQQHVYLTRYPGNALTGEVKKEGSIIRHYDFVGPTSLDFTHLRVVCLGVYDHLRPRPYTVQLP